ncbi:hypothetical protein A5666_00105 [Mycolicibacterium fortuitum]|uniref:hypothetical protein n=1 Tax=Mycolicibacterium fortuitum TaxID=1766 RepID=UPI0007EA74A9|nr:hypothetical protein [Mycolicibacterium fortuitum]OBA92980.1 hypothetical protein A5665_10745 [Mycolicibacterium fortuitum]OBI66929.1 hypothetical protein A5666_00105 [Mycolicibacterium fortuitum]
MTNFEGLRRGGRDIGLRAGAILASGFALAAVCGTGPAAADPSNCESIPGLCDLTSNTPVTQPELPTIAPLPPKTGIDKVRADMPDFSFAHFAGVGLIVMGLFMVIANKAKTPAGHSAHGPAAGAAKAEASTERAVGWLATGAGIITMGWALGGLGGAVLAAVIGVPVMLLAAKTGSTAATAKVGYEAADAQWQRQVQQAQAAQVPQPGRFTHLGLNTPAPATPPVHIPEPQMTDEDAIRFARMGVGTELPAGTAIACLVSRDGSDGVAREAWVAACKAVGLGHEEQRQSRIPGVSGTREVYVPAAEFVRVQPLDHGDGRLVVRPLTATIGTAELAKVTDVFLRILGIRAAGAWERDHVTGEHSIDLTNNREQTSETAGAGAPRIDPNWS